MPRPSRREQFQRIVRRLRKEVPASAPVRVKRERTVAGTLADCTRVVVGKRALFVIRIRPQAKYQEAVDSLIHEWAHCLSWSDGHPSLKSHDAMWGVAVSRVYCAVWPDDD